MSLFNFNEPKRVHEEINIINKQRKVNAINCIKKFLVFRNLDEAFKCKENFSVLLILSLVNSLKLNNRTAYLIDKVNSFYNDLYKLSTDNEFNIILIHSILENIFKEYNAYIMFDDFDDYSFVRPKKAKVEGYNKILKLYGLTNNEFKELIKNGIIKKEDLKDLEEFNIDLK